MRRSIRSSKRVSLLARDSFGHESTRREATSCTAQGLGTLQTYRGVNPELDRPLAGVAKMLISDHKKFVFVHIYKTGGSSITRLLGPHVDDRYRAPVTRVEGDGWQGT